MDDHRQTALAGFAEVLGAETMATLDALVPRRPWRATLPTDLWHRRSVLAHVDERGRRELHTALARIIGPEPAAAMMEYVPPVPWRVLRSEGVAHLLLDQAG